MNEIIISDKKIGPNHAPFIIAEMSANHNQSLERALQIVERAAKSGVHALKLQTYTPDTITLDVENKDFYISNLDLWEGQSLYKLYQKAYTPWEWHKPIFDKCRELGIIPFSSPFDELAVDFLEELEVPVYKIASFENNHLPLIRKVASTGKPMIISTGMATVSEIDKAVTTARESGCKDLILLKCTSTYPASPQNSNINTIPHMRTLFDCQVGLSDHTLGIGVAVASIALGATVIEKHFTLSREDGGVDAEFSLEPQEMEMLVKETERAWKSLGKIQYGPTDQEKESSKYRRSLYISKDMKKGEKLTTNNLKIVRPGYGLSPEYYEIILGREIKQDVKKGTALTWDLI